MPWGTPMVRDTGSARFILRQGLAEFGGPTVVRVATTLFVNHLQAACLLD